MPHGWCYLWSPFLILLHGISDVVIGTVYFCVLMPLLIRLRKGNRHGGLHWFFYWFAAFIALCGLTHFGEVLNIYKPWYYLTGFVKLATAIVSVEAAIHLYRYRELIANYPTPDELQEEVDRLREFIAATKVGAALRSSEVLQLSAIVDRIARKPQQQSPAVTKETRP